MDGTILSEIAPRRSSTPISVVHDDSSTSSNSQSPSENDSCSLPSLHLSLLQSEGSLEDSSIPQNPSPASSSDVLTTASQEPPISHVTAITDDQAEHSPTMAPTSESAASATIEEPLSAIAGYKLEFDNLDKNVKPRFMRYDSQTVSLHYVQVYAVKDRIDYSIFSSEKPTTMNLYDVLPTSDDYELLKQNFTVLVSRIIHSHLPFFGEDFKGLVKKHIPHKYSAEMCKKSEVVSV